MYGRTYAPLFLFRVSETKIGPDICQVRGRAIALADGFWSQDVLSAFHLHEVISDPFTAGSCICVPCFHHWMRSTLDLG